jgi:HisJ family histidinol phosphate phosphatase
LFGGAARWGPFYHWTGLAPNRCKGSKTLSDPRTAAIPDCHGHAKGEHRPFAEERPIAYSARMLFLWFYHACRRGMPRFLMVADHINYLTFEDPGAVNTVRRALNLAQAGDLYGAAEVAGVDVAHAAVVSEGLRRGMRFSIGAELDNDPRSRPDAQNIVEAMRPDGLIRSVHFITVDHPEKGADFAWPIDNEEFASLFETIGTHRVWELYMARLIDDIEKLPGNIVGHFYVPAKFGHWPDKKTLEQYEDRLLDACAARGMAVEINTRFLYREHAEDQEKQYIEANRRLMRKAKAKNVGIAIGSGAHSPRDQAGAFDTVLKMLDDAGVNELVFPVLGRLARVALRATREHLERHTKKRDVATPGSSITGFGRAELGLPEQPEPVAASRSRRDVGPKKRTTGPARTTKTPAKPERSAKTKPAKPEKPPKPVKSAHVADASKTAKKISTVAKAPAKTVKKPAAIAQKKAALKPTSLKPAAKKAAKKSAPAKKAVVKKTPAPKLAARKVPVKKLPASKKTAPVKKAAPAKKAPVAKKPGTKKIAAAKKAPMKKTTSAKKPSPSKAAVKRGASKGAATKAAVKKKPTNRR